MRMPLDILQRHLQMEKAIRCVSSHFKEETRQVRVTQRSPPSSSRLGKLLLRKTLHAQASQMFPLPAVWSPSGELHTHSNVWHLQRQSSNNKLLGEIQGKAVDYTQMPELLPSTSRVEPEMLCSHSMCESKKGTSDFLDTKTTTGNVNPSPLKNLCVGPIDKSLIHSQPGVHSVKSSHLKSFVLSLKAG